MRDLLWPHDPVRRAIHLMGASIFLGTLTIGLGGLASASGSIGSEVLPALIGGAAFGAFGLAPYVLGSAAALQGARRTMLVVCSLAWALDAWARFELVFFPSSSTHALIIVFLPIYLGGAVLAAWIVTRGLSTFLARRG